MWKSISATTRWMAKMAERRTELGHAGWLLLAAGVYAWDRYAPETFTDAFQRGMRNPHSRPLVIGVWGLLTIHLHGLVPRKYDPFHILFHSHTQRGKRS